MRGIDVGKLGSDASHQITLTTQIPSTDGVENKQKKTTKLPPLTITTENKRNLNTVFVCFRDNFYTCHS